MAGPWRVGDYGQPLRRHVTPPRPPGHCRYHKLPPDAMPEFCPLRPHCLGVPTAYVPVPQVRPPTRQDPPDPRILPYGLPPLSYDVKKRADWLNYWMEEANKPCGRLPKRHKANKGSK